MPSPLLIVILIAALFGYVDLDVSSATAAEQAQTGKKPKSKTGAKTAPPKTAQPKFQSADTAESGKACFGVAPKIETVSPDEGKSGQTVTITGANLGAAECLRGVSFGPGHAANFTLKNATTITATVPSVGRKGLVILTVTTASGEDSKPFLLK